MMSPIPPPPVPLRYRILGRLGPGPAAGLLLCPLIPPDGGSLAAGVAILGGLGTARELLRDLGTRDRDRRASRPNPTLASPVAAWRWVVASGAVAVCGGYATLWWYGAGVVLAAWLGEILLAWPSVRAFTSGALGTVIVGLWRGVVPLGPMSLNPVNFAAWLGLAALATAVEAHRAMRIQAEERELDRVAGIRTLMATGGRLHRTRIQLTKFGILGLGTYLLINRTDPWWVVSALVFWALAAAGEGRLGDRATVPALAAAPLPGPPRDPLGTGLTFLAAGRDATGGYPVLFGRDRDLGDGVPLPSVFATALIARSLARLPAGDQVKDLTAGLHDALRREREPDGRWRYFGRGSLIPADVDDTSYALLVLPPEPGDEAVVAAVLANRSPEGRIHTWFLEPGAGPPTVNGFDRVVNANVATMLRARDRPDHGLEEWLRGDLGKGRYREGSQYYPSPWVFLHAMAGLGPTAAPPDLVERECLSLLAATPPGDPVDTALALGTLVRIGRASGAEALRLREALLASQAGDGGWPAGGLFAGCQDGRLWYGSRELTTALALEAVYGADAGPGR